eukprot:5351295-Ditylum_brightwellii.AAC.1
MENDDDNIILDKNNSMGYNNSVDDNGSINNNDSLDNDRTVGNKKELQLFFDKRSKKTLASSCNETGTKKAPPHDIMAESCGSSYTNIVDGKADHDTNGKLFSKEKIDNAHDHICAMKDKNKIDEVDDVETAPHYKVPRVELFTRPIIEATCPTSKEINIKSTSRILSTLPKKK